MGSDDNFTAFDLKVKKTMLPWLLAFTVGGLGGTNLGLFGDMWRTREWKDSQLEKIQSASSCRERIAALEVQTRQLLRLLDGASIYTDPELPE